MSDLLSDLLRVREEDIKKLVGSTVTAAHLTPDGTTIEFLTPDGLYRLHVKEGDFYEWVEFGD